MRRIVPALLLSLLLLPALPAFAQAAPAARVTQVDTSQYPHVTLYVSVTNENGQPIGGLTARDFTITEDAQPVTIDQFTSVAGPISTVLVIDHSGSMGEWGKMEGAQAAARAFVDQMRPGDQSAIIAFASSPKLVQPFTSDKELLNRSIRRIHADGATALYDSMIAGVDQLQKVAGRRALLLLTDGRDIYTSGDTTPASTASLDEAIASANSAGIAVQTIGLGNRTGGDQDGIDEAVLQRIAQETGGKYFYTPNADQLAQLYQQMSMDMQQEYTLTYRSPRPFYDGTRRDIRVQIASAPAATGGYVEQHLLQVRSHPLVGVLLLLPVLGALLLPLLINRSKRSSRSSTPVAQANDIVIVPVGESSNIAPATGSTIFQAANMLVLPADVAHCTACNTPLLRADAKFCSACGAAQPTRTSAAPKRAFCDQCGRPIHNNAHFCSHCGAATPMLPSTGD